MCLQDQCLSACLLEVLSCHSFPNLSWKLSIFIARHLMDNSTLPMRTVFWRSCSWRIPLCSMTYSKSGGGFLPAHSKCIELRTVLQQVKAQCCTVIPLFCACSVHPAPWKSVTIFLALLTFPLIFQSPLLHTAVDCFNLFLQAAVPIVWHFRHHRFAELTACLVAAWAVIWLPRLLPNEVAAELFPKL